MKATDRNAIQIMKAGGAIQASDWTTGRGRFISKRPIPNHCAEIDAGNIGSLVGFAKKACKRIVRLHPMTRKIIYVRDIRAVRKIEKV